MSEKAKVIGWWLGGCFVLLVFVAACIVVTRTSEQDRKLLVDTTQVVGVFGVFATVGALFTALYQLRKQRESSDAQSETAAEQARLQRDAIAKQQAAIDQQRVASEAAIKQQQEALDHQRVASDRAIAEQRRAVALERFNNLRAEYARYLAAAHEMVHPTVEVEPRVLTKDSVHSLTRALAQPRFNVQRVQFDRAGMQLSLHDRDVGRRELTGRLARALHMHGAEQPALTTIARLAQEIREIVDKRFPPTQPLDSVTEQLIQESLHPNDARDPAHDELANRDQSTARTRVLRAALQFAHRGIASSLDADEQAAGLPPVNTADGYVAPEGPASQRPPTST